MMTEEGLSILLALATQSEEGSLKRYYGKAFPVVDVRRKGDYKLKLGACFELHSKIFNAKDEQIQASGIHRQFL